MWAAEGVLTGFENSLYWSRKRLRDLPSWIADPTIVALLAEKKITQAAIAIANEILKGAQAVVEWAPVDLDPRVAPFIALKGTANLALAAAYEAVKLLGDVVEDFDPKLHPRGKCVVIISTSTKTVFNVI